MLAGQPVQLFDVATGRELRKLKFDGLPFVDCLSFSPDGRVVAVVAADGRVVIWEADTGKVVQHFASASPGLQVVFSPDSRNLVAAGEEGTVLRWDSATGVWQRRYV